MSIIDGAAKEQLPSIEVLARVQFNDREGTQGAPPPIRVGLYLAALAIGSEIRKLTSAVDRCAAALERKSSP